MKPTKLTRRSDYVNNVRKRGTARLRAIFSAQQTPTTKHPDPDAAAERWDDMKRQI